MIIKALSQKCNRSQNKKQSLLTLLPIIVKNLGESKQMTVPCVAYNSSAILFNLRKRWLTPLLVMGCDKLSANCWIE